MFFSAGDGAQYPPDRFFFHRQKYLQEQEKRHQLLEHNRLQLQDTYVMFESPSVFGAEHPIPESFPQYEP